MDSSRYTITPKLYDTLFVKACQGSERVQNLDKLGLSQVHSPIENRLAVQYSSSGGASLPDCVGQNSKTSDGGKDDRKGAI